MVGRLDGKVAMITGAASGIGLGTVELFVAEGAKVVAADIQDEKGAMLEKRFPGKVVYAHCDVTKEADIEAAVKKAKTEFGGLDILFNNAGISDRMSTITEITAEGWSWIFDILVRGPALGMKHTAPLML
ncbi:MAG: SDR family oxidoreductase, partial [Caulobacteraceae bacterium]